MIDTKNHDAVVHQITKNNAYLSRIDDIKLLVDKTFIMEIDEGNEEGNEEGSEEGNGENRRKEGNRGIHEIIMRCEHLMKIVIQDKEIKCRHKLPELLVMIVSFELSNYLNPNKISITTEKLFEIIKPYYDYTEENIDKLLNILDPNDVNMYLNMDTNTINKEQFVSMLEFHNNLTMHKLIRNNEITTIT